MPVLSTNHWTESQMQQSFAELLWFEQFCDCFEVGTCYEYNDSAWCLKPGSKCAIHCNSSIEDAVESAALIKLLSDKCVQYWTFYSHSQHAATWLHCVHLVCFLFPDALSAGRSVKSAASSASENTGIQERTWYSMNKCQRYYLKWDIQGSYSE